MLIQNVSDVARFASKLAVWFYTLHICGWGFWLNFAHRWCSVVVRFWPYIRFKEMPAETNEFVTNLTLGEVLPPCSCGPSETHLTPLPLSLSPSGHSLRSSRASQGTRVGALPGTALVTSVIVPGTASGTVSGRFVKGQCWGSNGSMFSLLVSWFLGICFSLYGVEENEYVISYGYMANIALTTWHTWSHAKLLITLWEYCCSHYADGQTEVIEPSFVPAKLMSFPLPKNSVLLAVFFTSGTLPSWVV